MGILESRSMRQPFAVAKISTPSIISNRANSHLTVTLPHYDTPESSNSAGLNGMSFL
jgi:hypothetical protein